MLQIRFAGIRFGLNFAIIAKSTSMSFRLPKTFKNERGGGGGWLFKFTSFPPLAEPDSPVAEPCPACTASLQLRQSTEPTSLPPPGATPAATARSLSTATPAIAVSQSRLQLSAPPLLTPPAPAAAITAARALVCQVSLSHCRYTIRALSHQPCVPWSLVVPLPRPLVCLCPGFLLQCVSFSSSEPRINSTVP